MKDVAVGAPQRARWELDEAGVWREEDGEGEHMRCSLATFGDSFGEGLATLLRPALVV